MSRKNNSAGYTHAMTNVRVGKSGPDYNDILDVSNAYHSDSKLRRLCDEFSADGGSAIGRAASMGGVRRRGSPKQITYGRMSGMGGGGAMSMGQMPAHMGQTQRFGGRGSADYGSVVRGQLVTNYTNNVPHYPVDPTCEAAPQDCSGDLLGFNTLSAGGFPLPAPVAPAVIAQGQLNIGSATADKYIPRYLFWEGRDANQNFAVVPSLLVDARIGPNQQTVGSGVFNSITSAVFALTLSPLPVGWDPFRNVDGQTLLLNFGTFIQAADVQFFGCLWGDAGLTYAAADLAG